MHSTFRVVFSKLIERTTPHSQEHTYNQIINNITLNEGRYVEVQEVLVNCKQVTSLLHHHTSHLPTTCRNMNGITKCHLSTTHCSMNATTNAMCQSAAVAWTLSQMPPVNHLLMHRQGISNHLSTTSCSINIIATATCQRPIVCSIAWSTCHL